MEKKILERQRQREEEMQRILSREAEYRRRQAQAMEREERLMRRHQRRMEEERQSEIPDELKHDGRRGQAAGIEESTSRMQR